MTEKKLPNWLAPGKDAVILAGNDFKGGYTSLTEVKVERVLKRDIVLSNGDRFSVTELRDAYAYPAHQEVTGRRNSAWDTPPLLVGPLDPRVKEHREKVYRERVLVKAEDLIQKWRRNRDDKDIPRDLLKLLEAYLGSERS